MKPIHIHKIWLAIALTIAFLLLYLRTSAPSVLSGDSAEFQLASATWGVPHPTTYPLYTMLGALAIHLAPSGDMARRVTQVSALCAALALGVFAMVAQRLGLSRRATLIATVMLGVSPGLWNAATLAEVYSLLALLMLMLALALRSGRVFLVGLIVGLGCTHHGLFTLTALPVALGWMVWRRWRGAVRAEGGVTAQGGMTAQGAVTAPLRGLIGCMLGGLVWLYPVLQYARYGPFDGQDYGLPRHYFWGAPQSWSQLADLLLGGTLRREIFQLPTAVEILATLSMLAERALFEYGWLGLGLGIIGMLAMFRRERSAWLAAAWVILATAAYLMLLGPAVADAPIFTLPMLLPWALWIAYGVERVLNIGVGPIKSSAWTGRVIFILLLIGTLFWGESRVKYANKHDLWLYRSWGEQTLSELAPNAVVLAHWEQGMALQYLHLVEHKRPDVWIDVVEPGDEAWAARIARRYAGKPVYLVGSAADLSGLPVDLVREDDYALLFRLKSSQ